jgi:neutral ceramidase
VKLKKKKKKKMFKGGKWVVVAVVALWMLLASSSPALAYEETRHATVDEALARAAAASAQGGSVRAGAAKVNGSLVGVPLAGYNHGKRRVPFWPVPEFTKYTSWMTPSTGVRDTCFVKALVIEVGSTSFCFITMDGIGSEYTLLRQGYEIAAAQGFPLPFENLLMSGSHSHSGPGAIAPRMLWSIAPAIDFIVAEVAEFYANAIGQAMMDAYSALRPARIGAGMGNLVGVTANRRASFSPYVNKGTIDPHLGVLSLQELETNTTIATLWNFAIHGVCYGPDNLEFSADIMGYACDLIEAQLGGVALFVNGDAGDIDPAPTMCDLAPHFKGSPLMADAVVSVARGLTMSDSAELAVYAHNVPFGPTNLNYTLGRFNNCTTGGTLDICTLCSLLRCDINVHMPSSFIENDPIFTALRLSIAGNDTVIVSIPGEALVELGWWIRNDTQKLGFENTFLAGYSNSHMGYFATPDEYDIGGYESQLTLWGIDTAQMVRAGCYSAASKVTAN